jgi:poly(A) polymerase
VAERLARQIVARLRAAGQQALLAGGCVRDRLLGLTPQDWDVATDAPPVRLRELFPSALEVGAHFGVVLVREADEQVEVATFRSDHSYKDGRRPEAVTFESDPRKDAARRDFTVNALFEDPATGAVADFVGGRADLAAGIIRAVGDPDRRFAEDHLRLLRAVRLAARLGFSIEPATLAAIRRHAPAILRVAAERIREELNRILTEGAPRRGVELLDQTGLLEQILPEVARLKGVTEPPEFHPEGDVWTHTLLLLEHLERPTVTLALGALLHDIGKPGTWREAERIRFDGHDDLGAQLAARILDRLKYSSEEKAQVIALVAQHMRFKDAPRMRQSTLRRFLRQPRFDEHLELHRLDRLASNGQLDSYQFVAARLAELGPAELRPAPLLSGRDLLAAGYPQGPLLGRILAALEEAQLEGAIDSREQALAFVAARFTLPPP